MASSGVQWASRSTYEAFLTEPLLFMASSDIAGLTFSPAYSFPTPNISTPLRPPCPHDWPAVDPLADAPNLKVNDTILGITQHIPMGSHCMGLCWVIQLLYSSPATQLLSINYLVPEQHNKLEQVQQQMFCFLPCYLISRARWKTVWKHLDKQVL